MRILILLDKESVDKKFRIDNALEIIRSDYFGVTNVEWSYQERDFSDLRWVEYLPDALGIELDTLRAETKSIWKKSQYAYDHIIWCVDPVNWKAPGIGGWNLGGRFDNYYPQIVKVSDSDSWLYKIFAMEIFHAMDEIVPDETGVNLNRAMGMDFDNDVVHGENPKYGVKNSRSHTGYFTNYKYRPIILELRSYISGAYGSRDKKLVTYISKLKLLVLLLQKLLGLFRKLKPKPFFFKPHNH